MKALLLNLDALFIGRVEAAVLPLAERLDVSCGNLEKALDFGFSLFLILGILQTTGSVGMKLAALAVLALSATTLFKGRMATSTSADRTSARFSVLHACLRLTLVIVLVCALMDMAMHFDMFHIFTLLAILCLVLYLYVKASYGGGLKRKSSSYRSTSKA